MYCLISRRNSGMLLKGLSGTYGGCKRPTSLHAGMFIAARGLFKPRLVFVRHVLIMIPTWDARGA